MFGFQPPEPEKLPAAAPLDVQVAKLNFTVMQHEARIHALEQNLFQLLNLLNVHINQTQANEAHLHDDIHGLMKYVMTPRQAINGEGRELN